MNKKRFLSILLAGLMTASLATCNSCNTEDTVAEAEMANTVEPIETEAPTQAPAASSKLIEADITVNETIENSADGEDASYRNIKVVKTGGSGDAPDKPDESGGNPPAKPD